MIYSDAYMEKVDTFAWHARHKRRQNKVVEALERPNCVFRHNSKSETPQFDAAFKRTSVAENRRNIASNPTLVSHALW